MYFADKRTLAEQDLRFGLLASLLYNANRGKGKALGPGDFFPSLKVEEPARRQRTAADVEREKAGWRALALAQQAGKVRY